MDLYHILAQLTVISWLQAVLLARCCCLSVIQCTNIDASISLWPRLKPTCKNNPEIDQWDKKWPCLHSILGDCLGEACGNLTMFRRLNRTHTVSCQINIKPGIIIAWMLACGKYLTTSCFHLIKQQNSFEGVFVFDTLKYVLYHRRFGTEVFGTQIPGLCVLLWNLLCYL